jgi:hypothetical protein
VRRLTESGDSPVEKEKGDSPVVRGSPTPHCVRPKVSRRHMIRPKNDHQMCAPSKDVHEQPFTLNGRSGDVETCGRWQLFSDAALGERSGGDLRSETRRGRETRAEQFHARAGQRFIPAPDSCQTAVLAPGTQRYPRNTTCEVMIAKVASNALDRSSSHFTFSRLGSRYVTIGMHTGQKPGFFRKAGLLLL